MFLNKKTKKAIRIAWMVLGVLIIFSMILLYAPIFSTPNHSGSTNTATTQSS